MTDDEFEDVDEAADAMEDVDTSTREQWFARGYIITLVTLILSGLSTLIYFDYVTVAISLDASISVGWIIEYFVAAIALFLAAFTGFMVIKAVGGNFIAAVIRAAARIADNYERP